MNESKYERAMRYRERRARMERMGREGRLLLTAFLAAMVLAAWVLVLLGLLQEPSGVGL